jgi:hypothetical protein
LDFLTQYDKLFDGRRDVYGEGFPKAADPSKYSYRAVYKPLTQELLLQHLRGALTLGVYPIREDETVAWFAMDVDGPKDGDGFEQALEVARQQVELLERAGLTAYIERSRSGQGTHVWGFLDKPLPAAIVRQALRPHLIDDAIFDKMYPVQDDLDRTPLGNLICLPFQGEALKRGCAVFLDAQAQPINPREFLAGLKTNPSEVVEHIAGKQQKLRPVTRTTPAVTGDLDYGPLVTGALKVISPFGCQFMRNSWVNRRDIKEPQWYAAIQVATHFEHGRDFAHILSQDYPNYVPEEVDSKFDQAVGKPRIGCDFIHERFPKLACTSCPNNNGKRQAPHYRAKESILGLVRQSTSPMEHVGDFGADLARIDRLNAGEDSNGYRWGIPGLDSVTRLRPSELTVVGALPSMGKTWLMVDGMYRLAKQGVAVFCFSAETGRESLRQRLLARAAQVDSAKLKGEGAKLTPQDRRALDSAAHRLASMPIFIDYSSINADDVLAQIERTMLTTGMSFDTPYAVFFDYLQFGNKLPGEDSEYERLSRLSSEFKYVAKILEHPIVVFSQLKRENEGAETPLINWFKGTGRIESDLDVGLIITGERCDGDRAPRSITVVKQREGRANVKLEFVLQQCFGRFDVAPGSLPAGYEHFTPQEQLVTELEE